jgi:hypothetical protein
MTTGQRPPGPPIGEPEKKKNQTSNAATAMTTVTTTTRSAPVIPVPALREPGRSSRMLRSHGAWVRTVGGVPVASW